MAVIERCPAGLAARAITGFAEDFLRRFFLVVDAVASEGAVVANTRPVNKKNERTMGEMAVTRIFIDCTDASN